MDAVKALAAVLVGLGLFVVGLADIAITLHAHETVSLWDPALITAGAGALGVHIKLTGGDFPTGSGGSAG